MVYVRLVSGRLVSGQQDVGFRWVRAAAVQGVRGEPGSFTRFVPTGVPGVILGCTRGIHWGEPGVILGHLLAILFLGCGHLWSDLRVWLSQKGCKVSGGQV